MSEFKFNPRRLSNERMGQIVELLNKHNLSIQAERKDTEDETGLIQRAQTIAEQVGLSVDELVSYALINMFKATTRFVQSIEPIYAGGPTRAEIRERYSGT